MTFARLCCVAVLALPLSWFAEAQQAADSTPSGTVSGVITCGDTQRPARFASVTLVPIAPATPRDSKEDDKSLDDNPAEAVRAVASRMGSITILQAQTELDGSYTLEGVAPGDYYVSAVMPGYVSAVVQTLQAWHNAKALKARLAGLPVVHVGPGKSVRSNVTLERGAAVSGMVTYDDGSPAATVMVKLEEIDTDDKGGATDDDSRLALMPLLMSAGAATGSIVTTDDRGRFRRAGLSEGEYRVVATIAANKGFSMRNGEFDLSAMKLEPLQVYSPAALHRKDAATLKLKAGEERTDVDVRADLTGMHSVSGRVGSAVDHHALNAGTVTLVDTTDKDFKRTAIVDKSGSYTVHYVPAGTYTLTASGGADTEAEKPGGKAVMRFAASKTVNSYEDASQPLIVAASDAVGVNVECAESKTVKKEMDFNDLLKSMKE